jgi:hypothetical protein
VSILEEDDPSRDLLAQLEEPDVSDIPDYSTLRVEELVELEARAEVLLKKRGQVLFQTSPETMDAANTLVAIQEELRRR